MKAVVVSNEAVGRQSRTFVLSPGHMSPHHFNHSVCASVPLQYPRDCSTCNLPGSELQLRCGITPRHLPATRSFHPVHGRACVAEAGGYAFPEGLLQFAAGNKRFQVNTWGSRDVGKTHVLVPCLVPCAVSSVLQHAIHHPPLALPLLQVEAPQHALKCGP